MSISQRINEFLGKHGVLVLLGVAAGVVWLLIGHKTEAKSEPDVSSVRSPARVVRRSRPSVSQRSPQAEEATPVQDDPPAEALPPADAAPVPMVEIPAAPAPPAEQPSLALGFSFGGGGWNPGRHYGYGYGYHRYGYHGYGGNRGRYGYAPAPYRGGGARPAPFRGSTPFRGAVRSFAGRAFGRGRR